MSVPDRRTAAVQAYQEREGRANQAEAERKAQAEAERHRQNARRMEWLQKASSLIPNTVMAVSNDFVQRGSSLLLAPVPVTMGVTMRLREGMHVPPVPPVIFQLKKSGGQHPIARLMFEINLATGQVIASSTIERAGLPAPVQLDAVTPAWVTSATEAIFFAVMESSGTH